MYFAVGKSFTFARRYFRIVQSITKSVFEYGSREVTLVTQIFLQGASRPTVPIRQQAIRPWPSPFMEKLAQIAHRLSNAPVDFVASLPGEVLAVLPRILDQLP